MTASGPSRLGQTERSPDRSAMRHSTARALATSNKWGSGAVGRIVSAIMVVESTALYIFLSLPVSTFLLGVSLDEARTAVDDPASVADWFLWSSVYAMPAFVVSFLVGLAALLVERRFASVRVPPLGPTLLRGVAYDFINPFHSIYAFWVNKHGMPLTRPHKLWGAWSTIFRFLWAVSLFAYLSMGLLLIAR